MALLNTAENRPSVVLLVLRHLASQRGAKDTFDHLLGSLAPPGLSTNGAHQKDVRDSLRSTVDLGIVSRTGDQIRLVDSAVGPVRSGHASTVTLLREAVLAPEVNTDAWGGQGGARDLTNALAWYLTFSPEDSPTVMEGGSRSASALQTADFGPRQPVAAGRTDEDDDGGGWPIGNGNRWGAFKFWACSLGFAWVDPSGNLLPDPTPALRDALPGILSDGKDLGAQDFIDRVAQALPVLDSGAYRQFVERNWRRPEPDQRRLCAPLTDGLERLRSEGLLTFDDRADAPRVSRSDGTTFSHVRRGRT